MARTIYFEDIEVGFDIPRLVYGPVTKEQIKEYADVAGDPNPMHQDEEFAKMAGYKTVIAHGLMNMAYISRMLTTWLTDYRQLKRLKTRFSKVVYPGDTMTCRGKVTEKYADKDGSYVELEVWSQNQDGETVVKGTATVAMPSKTKKQK
jgi:acyl dehydratase